MQNVHSGGIVTASARVGSLALFTTYDPGDGDGPFVQGLTRSDGTFQGTFSIDVWGPAAPPPQGRAPVQLADSVGDLVFFTCAKNSAPEDRRLWRSDGTVAGTFPVTQGLAIGGGVSEPPVTLPIPERGLELFSASPRTGSTDFELWATDGTVEGTRLVKDINPAGSSNPRRMVSVGGQLFFFADTPQGRQLWRSDGTPEGTERVHDFSKDGFEILDLAQAGGALFIAKDTESGMEVWRSDGTEAGTEQVMNFPQRLHKQLVAAGHHLFLVARDSVQTQNYEIWVVDDGTGEPVRVLQAEEEIQLFAVGDRVAFSLEDDHGREPWWSDGTPEGTHRIADICPGACSSFAFFAGTYDGRAVLFADDGVSGNEPWLTDGTAAGTWRLGDLCPGECSALFGGAQEVNGWLVLLDGGVVWVSDGSRDGAWSVGSVNTVLNWISLPNRTLFASPIGVLFSLPVTAPAPPLGGGWLQSASIPGFRFRAQIGQTAGRQESPCMARTLCVSGAVPGRSEAFLRVSEPKPDGRLWPTLIKLTPTVTDVWVLQTAAGYLRHYLLPGSDLAGSTLSGILDREGFLSAPDSLEVTAKRAKKRDPQPPGRWIESKTVPGFRVQARLTSDGKSRILSKEPCIAETFCLSGATPGQTELLVRVTGPKPNRYFWPMMARFAPATLEVWIQQRKTGKIRYYRLNAPPAGSSQLDGYFDQQGFKQ